MNHCDGEAAAADFGRVNGTVIIATLSRPFLPPGLPQSVVRDRAPIGHRTIASTDLPVPRQKHSYPPV
ncbi:hypothetical protein EV129_11930 [Rhizobium azibense]|uniref:Uncharacterized protein n=1 Tax=Rhizobium azibense TaxID=1136135 RepID=A0A4R3RAZ6_9HYPH|nr:hypothetical protein EV129_11930 [Rhizobium azibense]